jgi:Ring finger domain
MDARYEHLIRHFEDSTLELEDLEEQMNDLENEIIRENCDGCGELILYLDKIRRKANITIPERFPPLRVEEVYIDMPLSCTICLNDLKYQESAIRTACFHVYHTVCLYTWLQSHTSCPECRQFIF